MARKPHLPGGPANDRQEITLDELMNRYELVDVDTETGVVLVTSQGATKFKAPEPTKEQEGPEAGKAVSTGEISGSGTTAYRRATLTDYNPDLAGRAAIDRYREMRNDSVVRNSLRLAKTPILSARWFIEPASKEDIDVEIANFVWNNLTRWMTHSWPQFLIDTLTMLDYGVSVFEKVFDYRNVPSGPDGTGAPVQRVVWRKFATRNISDVNEFVYDDEGGPNSINITTNEGAVDLEIWKALIFTYDKEAGDLWGQSALRSAYKHWYYKENLYKIDAIQKERHSIGIPVMKLPVNYTPQDKASAQRIAMDLRTNERAHVVLPPGWEVMFLKLEGNTVNALESAQHHAEKIYENVMANFLLSGAVSADEVTMLNEMFVRAVRFVAEIIRDVLNSYAIPQLIRYNWTEEETPNGFPELRVRRLGDERDWRTLSFALRNLIGAGALLVDDPLRAWIRDEMDLPHEDPDSIAQVETPQGNPSNRPPQPPYVGPPRQARPDNTQEGKAPPNPGRAGRDASGG